MTTDAGTVTPGAIWSVVYGYTAYWTVVAAIRLGIFDRLADGPLTLPELGTACDAPPDRLVSVAGALVAIGLLDGDQSGYRLTDNAAAFLIAGGDRYMGELVVRSPGPPDNWPVLAETLRGASPPVSLDPTSFFVPLVRATFPTQYAVACRTIDLIGPADVRAVLDVGTGAAPWSVALLQAHPDATATLNDLPEVLPEAERMAAAHHVADRCRLLPGDYHATDLGKDTYDTVVLGHVVRTEGPDLAPVLIARAARALRVGGTLILSDYFVDDDQRGPLQSLLLGVTMIANTDEGTTFTHAQYHHWLEDAGFSDIQLLEPLPFTHVLVARKHSSSNRKEAP